MFFTHLIEKLKIPPQLRNLSPPFSDDFWKDLDPKYYSYFLSLHYEYELGKFCNIKNPKSFTEKIQWLKLYDSTSVKTMLTDKIEVRDWIKEKIGEQYLKPLICVADNIEDIDFDSLPQTFFIKVNHASRWYYNVKDKEKLLSIDRLFEIVKNNLQKRLKQNFYTVAGLELHYKNIPPKLLVEENLYPSKDDVPIEYQIYCFNGIPKIYQKYTCTKVPTTTIYNQDYTFSSFFFDNRYAVVKEEAPESLKQAVELSKQLCEEFKLVRIDWLYAKDKLYFNEMTFTPYSGFYKFENPKWDFQVGKLLKL